MVRRKEGMVDMVSFTDWRGDERRMGRDGLVLDSTLTTVRLPGNTLFVSGPWPGNLDGSAEESRRSKRTVVTEARVLIWRGERGDRPSQRIHARGLYT